MPRELSKFPVFLIRTTQFSHIQSFSGVMPDILDISHLILKFLRVMNEPSALASADVDVNDDGSQMVLSHHNLRFSGGS